MIANNIKKKSMIISLKIYNNLTNNIKKKSIIYVNT